MGMFQPQNYGRDFNEAMTGMGNFLAGQDKAAADLEQRKIDNSRAERTLANQEASTNSSVEHNDAQTEKIKREEQQAALLQRGTAVYGKIVNGEAPDDEDVKILGEMRVKIPYLTNNVDDNTNMQAAHSTLIAANEKAKSLPASDKPFKFERGDSPETDKVLDAANVVTSADRHKTHVDVDGSVTGTSGGEYTTDQIQAFAGTSGNGTAATAAFFSIVDANGNPIYQRDAQGKETTQRKLVPSTIGQSNAKDGKVNFVPADAFIMKSKLALEQLQAEKRLTPEQLAKLKNEVETSMYGLMPNGAEKLLASKVRDSTPMVLTDGARLVDRSSGKVIADNPKTATKGDRFKVEEGVRGRPGWVQDVYLDGDNKEVKRGEPRLQFSPRGDGGGGGNGGRMSAEDQKNLTARNAAVARLSNLQVGKIMVDPLTNEQRVVTQGDVQAAKNTVKAFNDLGSGVYAPYPIVDEKQKDLSVAIDWVRKAKADDKSSGFLTRSRSDEDFKTAMKGNYTETEQQAILDAAATPAPTKSRGMAPAAQQSPAAKKPAHSQNTATSDGKNVMFQGKNYPMAADGTVSINGKKFRVQ
jgi:hypothetical protein